MRYSLFWDFTQLRLVVTDVSGQPILSIFKGTLLFTNCGSYIRKYVGSDWFSEPVGLVRCYGGGMEEGSQVAYEVL